MGRKTTSTRERRHIRPGGSPGTQGQHHGFGLGTLGWGIAVTLEGWGRLPPRPASSGFPECAGICSEKPPSTLATLGRKGLGGWRWQCHPLRLPRPAPCPSLPTDGTEPHSPAWGVPPEDVGAYLWEGGERVPGAPPALPPGSLQHPRSRWYQPLPYLLQLLQLCCHIWAAAEPGAGVRGSAPGPE